MRAHVARPRLSHSDARGRARMVDVAAKPETLREAVAAAEVRMQPATLRLVEQRGRARAARATCWRWRGWRA